jgi:zinc transporter ZupT
MMAFERLLVHLQKKNSAVISWMIASPVARDDEGVQILEMEHDSMASAADERDSAPMRPARVHGAAAHSSSSLHEVIDQNLAASTDSSTDRRPTEAKLRAAMMLVLAMTVHHIPESMALGVAVYGVSDGSIQQGQCIVLAAVLALQNIPEGAACTSSLRMLGMKNSWRLVFISQLAG